MDQALKMMRSVKTNRSGAVACPRADDIANSTDLSLSMLPFLILTVLIIVVLLLTGGSGGG